MKVILSHINCDFDAFASMLAASKLHPEAKMVMVGSPESNLRSFLEAYGYRFELLKERQVRLDKIEELILVDIAQSSRLGVFADIAESGKVPVRIYNHHPPTSKDIQKAKVIYRGLGATSSILLELIIEKGIQLAPIEATVLALGIYEDTGCMTYVTTTEDDLKLAAYLLSAGADLSVVSEFVPKKDLNSEQTALLGDLIRSLEIHVVNGIEIGVACAESPRYVEDLSVLTHKLKEMNNLKVLFSLVKMGDRAYIVGRSRIQPVDVGEILSEFDGGGHSTAASAAIKGVDPVIIKEKLLAVLRQKVVSDLVAGDMMSYPVDFVTPIHTVEQARKIILDTGHNCLPIIDEERLVGIVTKQDIDRAVQHGMTNSPVSRCMSSDVIAVEMSTPYSYIQQLMVEHRIGYLPVLSDGRLEGIVSRSDLLRSMADRTVGDSSVPTRFDPDQLGVVMKERLPKRELELFQQISEASLALGIDTYVVGGLPRDLLLNRPNWDVDIVVEGNAIAFARSFVTKYGGRVVTHERFGTAVMVLPDGFKVDVATARRERYEHPAALPVIESSVIKHDLYRRDFTINSIAIKLGRENFGKVIDYFGGRRDLKLGLVKVLHNLSFVEDPTRIVRAVRFEQRYGFRIDKKTEHLLRNAIEAHMLDKVAGQRIRDELILLLSEENPSAPLKRLEQMQVLRAIYPLLSFSESEKHLDTPVDTLSFHDGALLFKRIDEALSWFKLLYLDIEIERWVVYLLGLIAPLSKVECKAFVRKLSFQRKPVTCIGKLDAWDERIETELIRNEELKESRIYRLLKPLAPETLLFVMARSTDMMVKRRISLYFDQLYGTKTEITGNDLMAIGIPAGPIYRRFLEKVLDARLDHQVNSKEEELSLVKKMWEEMEQQDRRENLEVDYRGP